MCCYNRLHQQDSFWSWIVLVTVTMNDTLAILMSYCYSLILPILVKEFNQTRENAAWVSSIAFSLGYLASPLSAQMCACLGNRWTSVIGSVTCIAGLIGSSFCSSLEMMYFTHSLLFGLGTNFLHVPGILILQRYFKKRRSLATGIFSTSSSIASMMGPLFQLLLDNLGWRRTFWVIGLSFTAPLTLSLIFYSPNINDGKDYTNRRPNRRRKITCSFWNSWFTIGVIVIALQSFGMYPPLIHMVKHANEIGYPERKSSMLLVYIGITSLIGKVTAGRMLDSPKVCVFWINQVSGFITSISLVLLTFANDDNCFISFAIVYGIGNGLFVSSMYSLWLTSVAPEHRPSGLATGEVIAAIGVMTGSPFIGFLADQAGSYKMAFVASAVVLFAASMIFFTRFCFKKKLFKERNILSESTLLEKKIENEFLERETVL